MGRPDISRRALPGRALFRGAMMLCSSVTWPSGALAQAGQEPPPARAPSAAAVPPATGALPADTLLQLPRARADAPKLADDTLLLLPSQASDVPARGDGTLQLTVDLARQAALAPTARPVSRTLDDGRPRGFPVLTRRRADYDPDGIRIPSFTLYPSITLSANAASNVFLQPTGRSDGFGTARAALAARSSFTRHALDLDGFVEGVGFARYGSESAVSYLAHARGRLDVIGRDTIVLDALQERRQVDRSAVGETITTRAPVRFDRSIANVTGTIVRGRLALQATAGASRLNFVDARDPGGRPLDEDYRDYHRYDAMGEAAYQLDGSRVGYVSIAQEWRRARLVSAPRRDLDRTELLVGLRGELTPLVQGHVAAGYLQVDFGDASLRTRRTAAVDVRLDYLFSRLTSFSLAATRMLQNVSSFTEPGTIVTTLRAGVDHELYRNVIVSLGAVFNHADYTQPGQRAIAYGADAEVQYLVDRRLRLRATFAARKRDTRGFDIDRGFEAVTTGLGLTYQL